MVKFIVKKVRDGCRLGEFVVSDRDVLGNLQTPMCMLYTRGGELCQFKLSVVVVAAAAVAACGLDNCCSDNRRLNLTLSQFSVEIREEAAGCCTDLTS